MRNVLIMSCMALWIGCKTTSTQVVSTKAASFDQNAISADSSIRKGVLSNGMTYYLHSTDVVKDKASYYIIQNVGSILENDDQQGLAHFLEHMAFNGTKSYPGKEFLNTMQKNGLVFGRDINAYTSFDETVYNINNVPTTPEMTNHGLQILYDWANALLLTDEEIDAERGVIKEEWRTRQTGQMRIFEKTYAAEMGTSKYRERFPIGLMEIVENFEYSALRDFYHDWYRTDLQAIAIVGDIDIDVLEASIIEKFSSIPAIENPVDRFEILIPDNKELEYVLAMDKEVASERVKLTIRQPKVTEDGSLQVLHKVLMRRFISGIFWERLSNLSQDPESPFFSAQVGIGGLSRRNDALDVTVYPKPNMQHEAFALVMQELQRGIKFGFTQGEVSRQVARVDGLYENYLKELNNRSHGRIVSIIKSDYLEGEHMSDPVEEYEVVKQLFERITSDHLQKELQRYYLPMNRVVAVTGVEGRNNLEKVDVERIIERAETSMELKPYVEEDLTRGLMDGIDLNPGRIVNIALNDTIGFSTFTLSNGVLVHYKFVNKDENQIRIKAVSDGGMSVLDEDDYFNASLASTLASESGMGDFSPTDLKKLLVGKKVKTDASIDSFFEMVSGGSSSKDVETLLQLINLRFVKPRFEQKAFDLVKQSLENLVLRRESNLNEIMSDSMKISLYGDHPARQPLTNDQIKTADFEKIQALYRDRFSNAADFDFIIVGDVEEEILKPLLEQYIASIPTNDDYETWNKGYDVKWVQDLIEKDIYIPMENPKSSVRIAKKRSHTSFSLKDKYLINVLGSILQLRYTETLRESEGGTYGASSRGFYTQKPQVQYGIRVNFDCNPDMVDRLVDIVNEEIRKIANGHISDVDFEKTIKAKLKGRIEAKESNDFDLGLISTFVTEGYNLDLRKNFEDIINSISKADVQSIARSILAEDAQSYEIVFRPADH